MMNKRIQRRRTAGWRMPKTARYVGRGTKFGNPFAVGIWFKILGPDIFVTSRQRDFFSGSDPLWRDHGVQQVRDKQHAVELFSKHVLPSLRCRLHELRGHDLACWCKEGETCHADVLLEEVAKLKRGEK